MGPSRPARLAGPPGGAGWRIGGGLGTMLGMPDALLPWQVVRVSGPSMAPALRTGDRLVVRRGARVRVGDIVLARFADLPGVWVVKRAARPAPGAAGGEWIVESDNGFAGGDSAVHGPAQVAGRAVLLLAAGRRVPQRVPHRPAP